MGLKMEPNITLSDGTPFPGPRRWAVGESGIFTSLQGPWRPRAYGEFFFEDSLWHNVIMAKYFKKISMIQCIRCEVKCKKESSKIWTCLTDTFDIMGQWLAWVPGNGYNIRLGLDPIIGGAPTYTLSKELTDALHHNGYYSLRQVYSGQQNLHAISTWLNPDQLGLSNEYREEWDVYTSAFKRNGICLAAHADRLVWSWNKKQALSTLRMLIWQYGLNMHMIPSGGIKLSRNGRPL